MSALTLALAALAILPGAAQGAPERMASGERFDALIAEADADGDGAVTREEYDLARAQSFDRLDRNGDGVLDESERQSPQALERLGQAPDPRIRAAVLAIEQGRTRTAPSADANGDGVISRSEFIAAPSPAFERIDQNADGVLSADELAAVADHPARRLRRNP